MLGDRITMLIFSCDAFSDLWDGQIELLNKNWQDRGIRTCIITDKPTKKVIDDVEILSAGTETEFTERVSFALQNVSTEYVFVTLDDYYLIKQVETRKIEKLLDIMDEEQIDYLRLFLRAKSSNKEQIKDYAGICWVDTSCRYSVNLYSGIWRKTFMMKTTADRKNPWQYEVSLPRLARENGAKCAMSYNKEYVILDVVRKGKILNRANRYFNKHGVYHGNRPVHSYLYEFRLGIQTWGARLAPKWAVDMVRSFLIKRGYHFYSQDE